MASLQKNQLIMGKTKKIAFIFLDEIHHINHFVPIAIELAKKNQVSIVTYPSEHTYLLNKLKTLGGDDVKVEQLSTHWFRAFTDKLKNRRLPRNNFWVKKNASYIFRNFNVLIFSGFTHRNFLKIATNEKRPIFIKIPHGFSGRDHGYYSYFSDFDFKLLFGDFDLEMLKNKTDIGNFKIFGYPKFDVLSNDSSKKLFSNNKKTILYCPHFSPKKSSWKKFGIEILEFFYNQHHYNLIFAPHINLFNRKGGEDEKLISKKYYNSPNIHIDLGSVASVDMVHVKRADIYLGDISSQVYEFIIDPKPCIFINSENIVYQNDINYRFWQCGEVIDSLDQLDDALKNSEEIFKEFEPIQKKINSENYYTEEGSTASERAANAINSFLKDN